MDKHGFLLAEETLKIILAVIAIGFLIYFLSALYFSKVNGEKLKFAEEDIEKIGAAIGSANNGDILELDLINPEGWFLMSFVGGQVKPNSCFGENCLCICDNAWDYEGKFNRQQKKCDGKGSCLVVEDLSGSFYISIDGADNVKFILLKKDSLGVSIREK